MQKVNVSTIFDTIKIIEGSQRVNMVLPRGKTLNIVNALYSSNSERNLLRFKDTCLNGYHIEIYNEVNLLFGMIGCSRSILMQKIIKNTQGHSLKRKEILQPNNLLCTTCSKEKLIIQPSPKKNWERISRISK
ncbi:hypothetical protein CR513_38190, partial [Mucuna pruriens]